MAKRNQKLTGRIFVKSSTGEDILYHVYDGEKAVYHNDSLDEIVERNLTERLTRAASEIIANDPQSSLLNI